MTGGTTGNTVVEALARSLETAAKFNPNDVVHPQAVLWTDHDSQWQPIIAQLQRLLPQLLIFGGYRPEFRSGPAIWLRSVVDRAMPEVEIPEGTTPIIYLPGISRQELRAVQECPDSLKPLVELQYRGVCWKQKNGKDWTVEAFLVAEEGGLVLDVARDSTTRRAMLGALAELATTSVDRLKGKHLEAEDFDKLYSDDPAKDLLLLLNDPDVVKSNWNEGRWAAFRSRCRADYGFDPNKDGHLVGAELLGKREGAWEGVWNRFCESPNLYPALPDLLSRAKPADMFEAAHSSWPQTNESQEAELRRELQGLAHLALGDARHRIAELESHHCERRGWVWAKLDQAPLAEALGHLARLAEIAELNLGGASAEEMAKLYVSGAWAADAAALSAAAAAKTTGDAKAVALALGAIYRPWLEAAATHLQALTENSSLPGHGGQQDDDLQSARGRIFVFSDGLRLDVAQRLAERLRGQDWSVSVTTRWAGLPSVTATGKPAVSPVAGQVGGNLLGEKFLPEVADTKKELTSDRFRKLLSDNGCQFLRPDETGDCAGTGWTECGDLDKLGHKLQAKLAHHIDEQISLLVERIEELVEAGWTDVRVVTDHGWLWLPGGLPKVELPKYLTASRWSRCAVIKGNSRVEVPTVKWHWNPHERAAVAPGIACFNAGTEYAHGGLSLQECLIPVIRVTPSANKVATTVEIESIGWAGLRCRVKVNGAQAGLSIDLRTKVNDAATSLVQVRSLDSKGAASLLVEDDEMEGSPAVVVVLDAGGHVIVKQPTIIGGED